MSSLSQEVNKWELDTPSTVMDGDVRHPGNGSTQAQVVSFPTGGAFRVQRGGTFSGQPPTKRDATQGGSLAPSLPQNSGVWGLLASALTRLWSWDG